MCQCLFEISTKGARLCVLQTDLLISLPYFSLVLGGSSRSTSGVAISTPMRVVVVVATLQSHDFFLSGDQAVLGSVSTRIRQKATCFQVSLPLSLLCSMLSLILFVSDTGAGSRGSTGSGGCCGSGKGARVVVKAIRAPSAKTSMAVRWSLRVQVEGEA